MAVRLGICRLGCRDLFMRRQVCSWKRYCTASQENNPLLQQDGLPKFTQICAEQVVPAIQKLTADFDRNRQEVEEKLQVFGADAEITWEDVFNPLEIGGSKLSYAWSVVNHLMSVKNSDELRSAYQQIQPLVIETSTKLAQSRVIYDAIKRLNQSKRKLDEAQYRIINSSLLAAQLGGVELTGEKKEQFNNNRLQMAKLSMDFSNNLLDSIKSFNIILTDKKDVDGLPSSLLQLMALNAQQDKTNVNADTGPWKLTLDIPCYEPFMKHSKQRELRQRLYMAFITKASYGQYDNSDMIENIRNLRQENAKILGFKNFADKSLKSKMAQDVTEVMTLIRNLKLKSKSAATQELHDLKEFANSNGFHGDLSHWDLPYWSERRREQLFNFSEEELRPYFPLGRVLQGLFSLTSFLFGVKIKPADGKVEIWHEDVRFFDILNEQGDHIASFYLDPFTRPAEKRGGAWMDTQLGKSELLKTKPVAYLVCNQRPPIEGVPSLMTFREVETLFHEFGHGLQHMLTTISYADAAGINNIEWDAVELPSQLMENWVYDKNTMATISGHYQTGETLPKHLFDQLIKARKYNAGLSMLRQLYFSALDMELHTSTDPWMDVMKRVSEEYTIMKPLPEDRFPCSFQHIFAGGYSAGYYSYKWAEVMSADAFEAFQEVGLTNRDKVAIVGKRFKDTVLAMGGGMHPKKVFQNFRGRDPSPDALLKLYGLS
uniref:oligopeptidase A n=1 Tax=Saccoglossus kowalevskii TaxID=10224 RepID=A0ABM0M3H4_SACKO|nr:PREDICTED: organellar oligopeptidase A, chloroplastic/mitochondrial-like [Saccoglossus kowalevskii]